MSAAALEPRAAPAATERPQHTRPKAVVEATTRTPEGLPRKNSDFAKKVLFPPLTADAEEGDAAVPTPAAQVGGRVTAAGSATIGSVEGKEEVCSVADCCGGDGALLSLLPADFAAERRAAEATSLKGLTAAGWNAIQLGLWVPPAAWLGYAVAAVAKPMWFRGRPADLAWAGTTAAAVYWLGTKLRLLPTLSSLVAREATRAAASAPTAAGRVLVIGAGPVGLAAIKELREAGQDVTCYEGDTGIGGVYRFDPTKRGGVWDGVTLTSSPWVTAFSDFQPSGGDKHWKHHEYLAYLRDYAEHFGLIETIKFGHWVESVEDLGDAWQVTVKAKDNAIVETYDRVVICSGLNQVPKDITTPGADTFKGALVHSADYKGPEPYAGKRVMVVGFGESAVDIAHELAGAVASAHLSVRAGKFLIPRLNPLNGVANDYDTNRLRYSTPVSVANWYMSAKRRYCAASGHMCPKTRLRHELLECSHKGPMSQTSTKSDDFLDDVLEGTLSLCGNLEQLTPDGGVCDDGEAVELDAVVYAHGYVPSWPCLKVPQGKDGLNPGNLYLRMFSPEHGQRLAFLGYARPAIGAIPPTGEIQARYVAQLFAGKAVLPDQEAMRELVETDRRRFAVTFPGLCGMSPVVGWIPYFDRMAGLIGCKPDPWELLWTPSRLWSVMTGPHTGALYRLAGPGANPEVAEDTLKRLPRMHQLSELLTMVLMHAYADVLGTILRQPALMGTPFL